MPASPELKPEELSARLYADRLILEQLTKLHEVVKPSEIAEKLKAEGLGLAAVRSLLASNPQMFAYNERRWVPAAQVEGKGRPFAEVVRLMAQKFGAPMPVMLIAEELCRIYHREIDDCARAIERIAKTDPNLLLTRSGSVVHSSVVFTATDEPVEIAAQLNGITVADIEAAEKKLGKFDWYDQDATILALEKAAPVNIKALGGAAWRALNPADSYSSHHYDWKAFNAELLSIPGFVLGGTGTLSPESEASEWIKTATKISSKVTATIEVEDVAPLELKKEDIEQMVKTVLGSDDSSRATEILESQFEITPAVKTFPDDLANVMNALKTDKRVSWVGGDRFQKPGLAPDFINEIPEPFIFVKSDKKLEDGDPVDAELSDEGLSTSLRKLMLHPLATDVMDEDIMPEPKTQPEQMRLVLKPVHRELGTFPLCQFPTGWFESEPGVQELIFIDPSGKEQQVWVNHDLRLMFNLFEWWLEQPVESGAVFSLTKTEKANVFEFKWLEQTDPVVYISTQRMEELREIASNSQDKSTFEILCEVMTHWPKGADFLTVLWEINVVRRTSRRLLASLLSSYVCFYQRSGSPVWHYDHKKVEQGFDKSKKKFILKD